MFANALLNVDAIALTGGDIISTFINSHQPSSTSSTLINLINLINPYKPSSTSSPSSTNQTVYAIIDVETTGGQARYERITEIAIVLYDGNRVVDTFSTLLNPERSIPWNITRLTGISD